jgi:hypothetical protein
MNKLIYKIIFLFILQGSMGFNSGGIKPQSIKDKVKDLISKMTLEEKVGQMTQIAIQVVSKTPASKNQRHQIDEAKLREAIIKYHVGSILNVYDAAYTIELQGQYLM